MTQEIRVAHIYISPGHNYVGHHQQPPGTNEIIEVPQAECLAGRGLRGDRFFDHPENHKAQVTFFAMEVYESLRSELGVTDKGPAAFRRNVITTCADLPKLVGRRFSIQGIQFEGVEESRPCYWMNLAFHPQAEAKLQGRGGLRARILTSGVLRADASDNV